MNSESVHRAKLEPGDLIRIGDRLLVYLQRNANEQSGLTPTRLAEATSLFRVQADARQSKLFETGNGNNAPLLSIDLLAAVLRFTTSVYSQPNLAKAAQLAINTITEAINTPRVSIWMTGIDGRLTPIASSGANGDDRLLASVCMERNEAVAYGSDWHLDKRERHYPTTAAPIPGRRNPRGAI